MNNHLKGETSPYLLQHSENPVDWFPWSSEAFEKAKREDKPIFLSIGYSTCHWCHVMAHECFEDEEIAELLNNYYVAIKVDKEERPDVDSIYMTFCQALTGSGGWPMSIFMTSEQKPFFAGTYFPKTSRYGTVGLKELLLAICNKWKNDRNELLQSAEHMIEAINTSGITPSEPDETLSKQASLLYQQSFDSQYGGFGGAPKFPMPHNLLFLMQQYQKHGDREILDMVEKTLLQMYRGGIFDHIGGGFSRYSTDRYYLVPHFEKMLYDNAMLILAYCKAYEVTGKELYKYVAERTAAYILAEMTSDEGGFFSAQDADSDGVEGKYYVFTPQDIKAIIGEKEGSAFCRHFNITENGNFEGGSIPNLLPDRDHDIRFDGFMSQIREYRKRRTKLHKDDKILTFWNSLMISALCAFYKISKDNTYLRAAERAYSFIEDNMCNENVLCVSWRSGKRGGIGYLDDYAGYIFALISLYEAGFNQRYLSRAVQMMEKAIDEYFDDKDGGFFLYGTKNESLIMRPKESYDGAIPSGNSLMTYNLVRLGYLMPDEKLETFTRKQLRFMTAQAKEHPTGYAMFLIAMSDYLEPPSIVTVVQGGGDVSELAFDVPSDTVLRVLDAPQDGYELLNGETAFYVCKNHSCLAPMNEASFFTSFRS